jgi:hypothetical protein
VPDQVRKTMPLTDDAVVAALPDAPMPQDQSQDQAQDPPPPAPAVSGTRLNQYPILSPGMTRSSLTFEVEPPRPEGRGFLDYAQRYSAHVSV